MTVCKPGLWGACGLRREQRGFAPRFLSALLKRRELGADTRLAFDKASLDGAGRGSAHQLGLPHLDEEPAAVQGPPHSLVQGSAAQCAGGSVQWWRAVRGGRSMDLPTAFFPYV